MAEALKNHAMNVHNLAGSNPCGVYVVAEQQAARRRHPATLHCLVAKGILTYKQRKLYWQLRTGKLPTNGNRFKWGKSRSDTRDQIVTSLRHRTAKALSAIGANKRGS